MKKYLMMGAAALAVSAAFVSCDKETNLYDPATSGVHADFADQFKAAFGEIAANNNWGFVPVSIYNAGATRGHNVNRNEWGTGNGVGGNVSVPQNVTENERQLVYNYFNQERRVDKSVQVNWSDYFISEVWKGEDVYKDGFGNDVLGSDKMNHLQVRYGEGSIDADGNLVGEWEHANDFNNGNHYSTYNTIEGHTYMNNSGTLEFAYHNATDSKYHNEYLIVPGSDIDASLAGYYYVAFDFYATHPAGQEDNKNMDVERDYVYTDWIVRISPAEFLSSMRIIAEDLAAADLSDFDYNDVVFDVAVANEWVSAETANKLVAHVTLQAAGGTMPLYIGQKDEKYEVHKLFGVNTEQMVNTRKNGAVEKAPVIFTVIIGDADYSGTYNYKNFPVIVDGPHGEVMLSAEVGHSPEKVCVETNYEWCDERERIATKGVVKNADGTEVAANTGRYPDFILYCSDPANNQTWWKTFKSQASFQ